MLNSQIDLGNLMTEKPKIGGYIGYYGLENWWLTTFTGDEKKYIVERFRKYHPRSGPESLLQGNVIVIEKSTLPGTPSSYLNFLTFIFRKPEENSIARRMAQKALEGATTIWDLDHALMWTIRLNYKMRDKVPGALDIAIGACKRHIDIAPEIAKQHKADFPSLSLGIHEGFSLLVKILEKRHLYDEVISLAKDAQSQGWKGDWDIRIDRCTKRMQHKSSKEGS
jgi:hypothetical protein